MTGDEYATAYRRFATYLRAFGGTQPFLIACGPNGNNKEWTQKSPQWLGYVPLIFAQVLNFDRVLETYDVQPFGCSQKAPTFYEESCTYGPNCGGRVRQNDQRKACNRLKTNWLLR